MSSKIVHDGEVVVMAAGDNSNRIAAQIELLAVLRRAEQKLKDGAPVGDICNAIIDEIRDVALLASITVRIQERARSNPLPFILNKDRE